MYIEKNQSPNQQCSEHKKQQTSYIVELFEAQVKQTPDDIAVVFEEQKLTYQELNVKANQLAHHLQNLGVKPEVLVGICVERSLEMVIGLLAILKAGGAYVPLDPAYPAERLAYMLSDSQASVLLTQSQLVSSLTAYQGDVVCLDKDWEAISTEREENTASDVSPNNLAYVIYTSGSTGKPKGVAMPHSCLLNLIEWQLDNTKVPQNAKTLQFAPISFDVSFQEIFSTCCAGGTLVLISEELRRDPVALLHLLAEKKVARLFLPFIALQQLAEVAETLSLFPGSLREVISGGEQLQITSTIANLFQKLSNCTLQNQYGPSESHTFTAYNLTGSPDTWSALPPIGQPITNAEIYLLDESLQPVAPGVEGDLYIGGVSLARGYLNRPELTEERFVFLDGKRLYKTGDLARYLPCGNIQFLGRKDSQVKIRGYRIELGELEVILSQYPEIKEAVVAKQDNRLVAYVVPGESPSATRSTEQIETWEKIWDEAYSKPSEDWETGFHIGGWYDSYTGKTLAEEQVREWIDSTVARISSLQPQRVLEIGCGTGLLLFQIAPHCKHYCGTDIAAEGLRYIEEQIKGTTLAETVSLNHSPADDLADIEANFFDTLIINGVIQFFPTMDYLVDVIGKMVQLVKSEGKIFIGDISSFPLLEAFHTSVQICQASNSTSTKILGDRIQEKLAQTKKLNIDPAFFLALKETFPQISHVEIQLKRGRYQNELTRFRYDVVIHVGQKVSSEKIRPLYLDWQKDKLSLTKVRQRLLETEPEIVIVNHVPNARIWQDIQAIKWLKNPACPETVGELKEKIQQAGIEPEDWWALESELPYSINLTWSGDGAEGYYEVIFQHNDSESVVGNAVIAGTPTEVKPWSAYGNQLDQGKEDRHLIPQLRSFLEDKLPDYMIPSAFVLLDKLPLTPSGKIDRRSLPSFQISRRDLDVDFVAPRTAIEEILATIWAEVIGLDQVGIYDNFFHLGGDSIQATQLISRIRDKCQIELPLRYLFESPNVSELSQRILEASQDKLERLLPTIEPVPREGELILSFAQQRIWFLDQLQSGSTAYNEPSALHLKGGLNVETLEKSLKAIAQRHEVLRTNFKTVDGSPVQVISPNLELNLPLVDLQHLPTEEQWTEVQRLVREAAEQYFDLAVDRLLRVTLLKLAKQDHVLLLTMHHIISDGWSMGVLIEELAQLYQAYEQEQPSPLPSLPIQYADFALWQRQWFTQELLGEQINYWKQQLAGAPPLLELPTDRPRPKILSNQGSHFDFELDRELTASLNALSKKSEATLFMILLAGFVTLLYRYSGQSDIVVGSPIANRNRGEIESLLGFFVNTLVLRNDLSGNPSFLELLSRVRGCALGAYEHQDVPFEQLVEILQPERSLSYSPLFQVAFAFQQAQAEQQQWGELTLTPLQLASVTTKFDLTLFLEETESGIEGRLEYNTDLFDAPTMARMAGHFQTLLASIVANPQEGIAQLPMLTATERHQLLVEWNDTATEYPQDKCIHQLFEAQAEKTPDGIAVVFEDTQITYKELNHRANQLAHYLKSKGVAPDVLVGICVERSLEMIVGLLGILKAGGAYVPLDSAYPTERIAYMLEDTQVSILLTQKQLVEKLPKTQAQVVCLDADWRGIASEDRENPVAQVKPDNLAYVIYTSGSTGRSKGVLIPHSGLLNLVFWHQRNFEIASSDCSTQLAGTAFDASVWELWPYLTTGATIYLVKAEIILNPEKLRDWLVLKGITITFIPTILAEKLLALDWQGNIALRIILTGGDRLSQYPETSIPFELVNNYGPTENTVVTTSGLVRADKQDFVSPPIGRPIANTQVYILDRNLQPVPIGVHGELHIGGAGLAQGYLNRPDLTEQKFIPNSFSETEGDRLYKTGDLARYLSDGNIEFIGRIDNQVKIRGFRIELGEIEAVLSQHPLVQETVVIAREDQPNQKRLVAYVVLEKEKDTKSKELRIFLKEQLPEYMIPSAFVFLEQLPLTPNGKVDRRALPAPDSSNLTDKTSFVPPRNNLELQLSQIWSEVLGVNPIGVQDNFFDLGGHSLLAVRLMAKIQQQLGTSLPLATLFTESTIENQATLLGTTNKIQFNSPLVPIEKSGNLTPFFLIHPVGGNVLCYADLARHLGNDRPIYGLQSPGLYGNSEPLTSIEDMAACYIKAIQTIQPQGPYYLGGWSLGGVIAWSMAQQLKKSGEEVSLLALIDSYAPTVLQSTEETDKTMLMKAFAEDLGRLYETELLIADKDFQSGSWEGQLQQILERAKQENILPPEIDIQQMGQIFQVFQANLQAMYDYQPQPYDGQVVLFCALDEGLVQGWHNLAVGRLDTYTIPGDHYTMLREAQVHILATQLNACLSLVLV